jgi:RND family efflux transporter MFP subunit
MKQLKHFLIWVPVGAILLTGCNSGAQNKLSENQPEAVRVKVLEIGTSPGSESQSYIATIEESVLIPLSFLAVGTVDKVLVDEGQSVNQGQLLAVLNSENYQNAYKIALSKENEAQDAFDRLEPVYKKGSLPEVKFVEIQTGLEMAKSTVLMSKKTLADCKLYAPTSGIIGKRMLEPGMSVLPGNPVFRLVKIEKVNANVPVPENEIAGIKKGQKAQVQVSALGDQLFEGEVKEIGVLSNPLSHTYRVKIELNNPEQILKPGMVCKVTIDNPTLENRVVVPLSAVQMDGNGSKFVFVTNLGTNKALKKSVQAGSLTNNGVVIRNGLSAGDLVITEGYQKINENTTIQIVK